jgi:hypothetical protein
MVLKDSSKYVKGGKKPVTKQLQQAVSSSSIPGTPGNGSLVDIQPAQSQHISSLMHSVQEGLSQILNPAQTFYGGSTTGNGVGGANNTSSSGNSQAQDPHKQTPTFTQHMSKIIIKDHLLDQAPPTLGMSNQLSRKRSSVNFDQQQ